MIYVFHHNDIDGHASAYLVKAAFPVSIIRFIRCDYTFPLSIYASEIEPEDQVFIVDYSFTESTVAELKALMGTTDNLVWIDHHKISIELVEKYPELVSVAGILDVRMSAAALTYQYFHENMIRLPEWIKLVSDYDTWQKKYTATDSFQYGLLASDWSVDSDLWSVLSDSMVLASIISKGEVIMNFVRGNDDNNLKQYGFETEFCGHKCLAINSRCQSSMIFDNYRNKYPVCVMYQFTGKCWKYSVYTDSHLDASALASVYGGGGHKGAAGFVSDTLLDCFTKTI